MAPLMFFDFTKLIDVFEPRTHHRCKKNFQIRFDKHKTKLFTENVFLKFNIKDNETAKQLIL